MPFGGLQATNFGIRVQNKVPQGKKLQLTRVAIGDGVLGSSASSTFVTMLSERMSFLISSVRAKENESIIIFRMTNEGLTEGFYFREIGVYARDPDTNEEGLYLYDNCRTEGEYIDDGSDPKRRVSTYMRLHIKFVQTDSITFDPGGDPLYVLYEEFDEHVRNNNEKFTLIESELAQQAHDIATIETRDDAQDTQIAELGTTLGQHGTDITGLKTDVESHRQQIAVHVADATVHITGAERTAWNGKATTATFPATLTTAGWVGEAAPFTQEVAVAGITGIMNPLTDIILSEETETAIAELEAWGMVSSITTGDGKITARCLEDKPEVDLNLQMKAVQ